MERVNQQLYEDSFFLGDQGLIGQERARQQLSTILKSDRVSHAYLFAGPAGTGKKATALAFAEAIQGVANLSKQGLRVLSKKSSWLNHPDIRIFIPKPTTATNEEINERILELGKDPYAVVDFGLNPGNKAGVAKNRSSFYPIDYFREEMRPTMFLRPNEGIKNVIIISNVETMKTEAANTFLKTLEEPAENLMFILTTDRIDTLLPTIISRCQLVTFNALSEDEIAAGLQRLNGYDADTSRYLARISGGNLSSIRFFDVDKLAAMRTEVVDFLRASYTMNAVSIATIGENWNKNLNREGIMGLFNLMESFIRDIMVFRSTENPDLVTNIDHLEVIKNFVSALASARLEEMCEQINEMRIVIQQSIGANYIFTVLAIRFGFLMRGEDTPIPAHKPHLHLPSFNLS